MRLPSCGTHTPAAVAYHPSTTFTYKCPPGPKHNKEFSRARDKPGSGGVGAKLQSLVGVQAELATAGVRCSSRGNLAAPLRGRLSTGGDRRQLTPPFRKFLHAQRRIT